MLRITIHETSSGLRLCLEGKLAGPWVSETERIWKAAQMALHNRPLIIDLCNVEFVDRPGEELLEAMHERGARLVAASVMMSHLVREIAGYPE